MTTYHFDGSPDSIHVWRDTINHIFFFGQRLECEDFMWSHLRTFCDENQLTTVYIEVCKDLLLHGNLKIRNQSQFDYFTRYFQTHLDVEVS